jgi:hypothetical protein
MLKNIVTGFAAVIVLVWIGMATNVQAKLARALGVAPQNVVLVKPGFKLSSCEQGARQLDANGFSHVFATDCTGIEYRYNGFRNSTEYTIVYNAQSNGFATVSK